MSAPVLLPNALAHKKIPKTLPSLRPSKAPFQYFPHHHQAFSQAKEQIQNNALEEYYRQSQIYRPEKWLHQLFLPKFQIVHGCMLSHVTPSSLLFLRTPISIRKRKRRKIIALAHARYDTKTKFTT
jgi:hypothetical protein